MCSKMSKQGCSWIGLEIGSGHILCVISFLGIDMMALLSIGIWNWIGVYLRSCLSSKMLKQGFPCIGLGHILCVISFLDIFFYHIFSLNSRGERPLAGFMTTETESVE